MQNSTPPVKTETCCSINQQTKVLCKKLVFSVTYLIAVSRPHYLPVYVRVCKLPSGKRTKCTVNCALLSHCTAYCCRSSTFRFGIQQQHLHHHNWGWYWPATNWRSTTQHPVPYFERSTTVLEQTDYCKVRSSLSDTLLQKGCTPLPEFMNWIRRH